MTKKMLVGLFAAFALVACGGGTQAAGSSEASTTSQGTEAPHIECGDGSGHHGGGCTDDGSGGETTTTTTTTTTTDGTAPADTSTPPPS